MSYYTLLSTVKTTSLLLSLSVSLFWNWVKNSLEVGMGDFHQYQIIAPAFSLPWDFQFPDTSSSVMLASFSPMISPCEKYLSNTLSVLTSYPGTIYLDPSCKFLSASRECDDLFWEESQTLLNRAAFRMCCPHSSKTVHLYLWQSLSFIASPGPFSPSYSVLRWWEQIPWLQGVESLPQES